MTPAPPPRTPFTPVALAYLGFVLAGLSVGVAGVLLPSQIDDYGVDKATIGITFFTHSAGFILAGATTGALIQRWGTRATLVLGGGAFALAGFYLATRPPFIALLAVQVLVGFGIGLLESVLNAYLAGLRNATTLLNRLHAFFGVGALIGPLVATRMLRVATWPTVWLVLALVTVPLVVGFGLAYPRREPPVAAGTDGRSPAAPRSGGLLASTLRERGVLLGALLLTVYVGLEIGMGNWAFTYLVEEREQADLLAGYAVSGYWLGLTLGRFLISPAANRTGLTPVGMTYGCLGGVSLAAAVTWLVPSAAAASAGLVLLGFFLGPIFPTAMAVVPRLTSPRLVPTAIGVMNAGSVVGGAALPWLAGATAQGVGLWTLPPFTLLLALAQIAIWWRMARRMRPEPDPEPGPDQAPDQAPAPAPAPPRG